MGLGFFDTHHFLFGFYYCESMIPTFWIVEALSLCSDLVFILDLI